MQCGYDLPKPIVEPENEDAPPLGASDKGSKKRLIGTIVGIITFALAYWGVQQIFFRPPSLDKMMVREAGEINKNCPVMVDQYTRLDNVLALPPRSFQYNYTLVNLTKAEVNLDTAKKYIEPSILNNVRTSPEMKTLRENKVTLIYYYRDKVGHFVYKVTVTPDMYR
ncbi:MAG TPA: hypothetical protein VFL76_06510 [Edaphocola sp.]|nr:hypothetical protein [Edaphocola sp.]